MQFPVWIWVVIGISILVFVLLISSWIFNKKRLNKIKRHPKYAHNYKDFSTVLADKINRDELDKLQRVKTIEKENIDNLFF